MTETILASVALALAVIALAVTTVTLLQGRAHGGRSGGVS